jgi:hypothetical protein
MGKFEINRIKENILYSGKEFNTVIETGTLFGNGTQMLSEVFKKVYTIEIQDELWNNATKRFENNKNIKCLKGDSADIIPLLKNDISENVVFFLDAHWSGDSSVDWINSSWKGYNINTGCRGDTKIPENQNPLDKELDIIMRLYNQSVIIYIDDMEKFDKSGNAIKNCCFVGEDWSHLSVSKIIDILQPRLNKYNMYNDQAIFILNPIQSD